VIAAVLLVITSDLLAFPSDLKALSCLDTPQARRQQGGLIDKGWLRQIAGSWMPYIILILQHVYISTGPRRSVVYRSAENVFVGARCP
jgi:hypothetical protein